MSAAGRDGQRAGEQIPGTLPTAPAPTVSTAPAEGPHRWWAAVPRHLGRARTSTVVLAVLFVVIGVLYLYVRPETTGTSPAGDTGDVPTVPAQVIPLPTPTTPGPTPAPTTSAPPTTTSPTAPGDEEEARPTDEGTPTSGEAPTSGETSTSEPAETPTTATSSPSPTSTGSPTGGNGATPTP